MTMIEKSEAGTVRVNTQLLWTVVIALAGMIWWGAATITSLQGGIAELKGLIIAQQVDMRALESRVRQGESGAVGAQARFEALQASLLELKAGQRDVLEILRNGGGQ